MRHLRAIPAYGILVIWEWAAVGPSSGESEDEGGDTTEIDDSGDDSVNSDNPQGQSCVDFKCIGVTQEPIYQTILELVRDHIHSGGNVPVRLMPEPDNPYDSKAIAFQCFYQGHWQRIGYVIAECCEEVLSAIESDDIVSVQFAWVKFKLLKKKPGYYASIFITRNGDWSLSVKRSKNTLS